MKRLNYVIFFAFCILISCSKNDDFGIQLINEIECDSNLISLDTVLLTQESLDFIPYTGIESFYFKNELGYEVKFEPLSPPISHSFRNTNFELTCIDGEVNDYEFTREQYAVSHKCDELNLQYYLNLYTFNSKIDLLFVDKFSFIFHEPATDNFIDTLIKLNIITSFKENELYLENEFESYQNYELLNEITLISKTFNNVYRVIQPPENLLTELYFNKEFGLIGFKDLNFELWVFDRFE